jgi:hypothetical protein
MIPVTEVITPDTTALAQVIGDPEVTSIGDPRKSSYGLRIKITNLRGAEEVERALCQLEIVYSRARPYRPDGTPASDIYLRVTDLEGLKTILDAVGDAIGDEQRKRLDELIRARGPIPKRIRDGILTRFHERQMSAQEIADELNEKGIVDGMGGKKWTARKVSGVLDPQ